MRYIMIALAVLIFTGCTKVSKENYDKIQVGMSYTQVTDILGKATHCDAMVGVSDCTWGDAKHYIKVKLVADKVMFMHSVGIE
ncbi:MULTISPECIES: outer membrane protein assembly factor BamE [unclassified Sulfurospirillum]|uniref:outer membrane protein assembly factor BamE domain-containing protein n=1 Tax=unclassified Sulfurospirillum TaxID=2618290 RepID=UPI00050308F5|nr:MULTISPECIES: outer membrane protein assembly factor BamE [unclassified Sulfurospirillum]KFL34278.1 lipoprotein [Sulfurospirillum sp. SCADC]